MDESSNHLQFQPMSFMQDMDGVPHRQFLAFENGKKQGFFRGYQKKSL